MDKLTDEKMAQLREDVDTYTMVYSANVRPAITELLALRAAWKIARPFLPDPVYRRCLAALEPSQ